MLLLKKDTCAVMQRLQICRLFYKCSYNRRFTSDCFMRPSSYCNDAINKRFYTCGYNLKNSPSVSYSLGRISRKVLSIPNPTLRHSAAFHSLGSNQRIGKTILNTSYNMSYIHHFQTRQLSFAWLESLAVTQAFWFRSLAESQLVEGLMGSLQVIHDSLHIPWWMSIILSTVLLRGLLTFPLAVYQNYIFAKLENLKPEMDELVKELKGETAVAIRKFEWTEKQARYMYNRSARRIWKELIIRENCHPVKASLLLWVQLPLWISMSMSFRNMASMMPHQDATAQILFLELSTGGFLWIPNLTEVDHSLILPFAMGIINLLVTEVHALSKPPNSRGRKIATNVFRVLGVVMIPIAATVPSCLALYWVTSSACGLVQNLALMHPRLRQACGIPLTPSQNPHPYQHLWTQLQNRFSRKQ